MTVSVNEIARDSLQAEVIIVGAGPAGLCCAIRLAQLFKQHNAQISNNKLSIDDIIVIEKAAELGMHNLSGAVMDPRALQELLPQREYDMLPIDCLVTNETLYWFTKTRAYKFPCIPRFMRNRDYPIVSLSKLVAWLGHYAEQLGVSVITNTAAMQLINHDGVIRGVRTDDKGVDRHGKRKQNYQAGINAYAKITVLAEGARGSLGKQLRQQFDLGKNSNPEAFALGIKELWEIPEGRIATGSIWHSSGYPLSKFAHGGAWLYALSDNRVSLGLMTHLSYSDPGFSPYQCLQKYKQHPTIRALLEGGSFLHYGAKTVSQGGYWSLPYPVSEGSLLIGDNAGLVDSRKLKGIHLAIKSGMLAAETVFAALLKQDYSARQLDSYPQAIHSSWIRPDMWAARNYHQVLQLGFKKAWPHLFALGLSGGRGLQARYQNSAGHAGLKKMLENNLQSVEYPYDTNTGSIHPSNNANDSDSKICFTLSTSVFHSATHHENDQPSHLSLSDADVCIQLCSQEYGNPCQYYCPAGVFEVTNNNGKKKQLNINAANCLHCKTCDIMDPYQIITWSPPEGGGGPQYESM